MVTVHEFDENRAFVDLVYADGELLRAEFDALVAACWDSPPRWPPRPKRDPTEPGKPSDPDGGRQGCQRAAHLPNPAAASIRESGSARPRGPPAKRVAHQ
jgi:hypothetical protein